MGKKRVGPAWTDWNEADEALRRIGEIDRAEKASELAMNRQIETAREVHREKTAAMVAERKVLEKDLKQFAESRRADLEGKQSKELHHGTVSFRRASKLIVHNEANSITAVKRVFPEQVAAVVAVKESLRKEVIEKWASSDLAAIGVTTDEKETFGYETKYEEATR
ncbi:hypothetical protein GC173_11395 [bacterium]|nr:hypothetical protein [bacterium]